MSAMAVDEIPIPEDMGVSQTLLGTKAETPLPRAAPVPVPYRPALSTIAQSAVDNLNKSTPNIGGASANASTSSSDTASSNKNTGHWCDVTGCPKATGKPYASSSGLREHKRNKHPELLPPPKKIARTSRKGISNPHPTSGAFVCGIDGCTRSYSSHRSLNDHQKRSLAHEPPPKTQRAAVGIKPFRCPMCAQAFKYEAYFNDHMLRPLA